MTKPSSEPPYRIAPQPECPKCHRAVDRFDPNTQRNASTRRLEHKDCRRTPRPRHWGDEQ